MRRMNPLKYIRKTLFKCSQAEFAEIARTTQATISRWENGEDGLGRSEMSFIRAEAIERGINWNDRLFFEVPVAEPAA